jgi:hypothetical protein
MADRNMDLRRANYKQKSQFNAADVSYRWMEDLSGKVGMSDSSWEDTYRIKKRECLAFLPSRDDLSV